jgi:hypothetical protein
MSKNVLMRFAVGLAAVAVLALTISSAGSRVSAVSHAAEVANVVVQNVETGEWSASLVNDDNSKINLNFGRSNQQGGRHQFGQTYDFAELGLSREQVLQGGPIKFALAREAGTIECEGSFQNGKGSGTFRFTGNPAFVAAMKSRGFDFESETKTTRHSLSEDRLFTAAALNITTALADDLSSAGFKLDVDDLFKATIFKIDSKFMREMKATGYPNLGMEELVKARIFKIDADLMRQVSQMGFAKEPFESLIKLRIFKVTPEFLTEVRNEGLTNISLEDAVKLRIFNIDGEFIRSAKAEGVPLDVERLVQKRLGVVRTRRAI